MVLNDKIIDISTEEKKKSIYKIFNSHDSILSLCKYFGVRDNSQNRKYIRYIANIIGFDLNIFYERRHPKRYCENCGKLLTRNQKRFCSNSCAAHINNKNRVVKESTKQKISKALTGRHIDYRTTKSQNIIIPIKKCVICGKEFIPTKYKFGYSKSKVCSSECAHILHIRAGEIAHEKSLINGTWKGWQSRNISSYAETFWKRVLDNNKISYIKEYHFHKKYFLDFYLEKNGKYIDLEIDGHQHLRQDHIDHDKERDDFVSSFNVIIYRIPWNQINNEDGKNQMKEKINKFLDFYNSL